jgi:small subunit ribosomal protein S18
MAQRRKGGGPQTKDRRPLKKKTSILTSENIEWIDYKDVNLLRRFMSERAKIRARRVTGNDQQQQAAVARAIKVAREMALLPYSVRQVTQRSKGRRDRGERGERGDRDRDMPMEAQATEAEASGTEAELEDVEVTETDETAPETTGTEEE